MNHRCPIQGCEVLLHHGKLMCRPHWGMLPKWLQNAVYRDWNHGEIKPDYLALRLEALELVTRLDKAYKEARP